MRLLILRVQKLLFSRRRVSKPPQPRSADGVVSRQRAPLAAAQGSGVSGNSPPEKAWRAVSIHPGENACEGSRALSGKRFLMGEAPHLPLPGCGTVRCQCKYKHHSDRRNPENDRRQPHGALQTQLFGQSPELYCRRRSRGRRRTD